MRASLIVIVACVLGVALPCRAHPAQFASATARIDANHRLRLAARFDLLAFALNDLPARIDDAPMIELLDAPSDALQARLDRAAARFGKGFVVDTGDGRRRPLENVRVEISSAADVRRWRDSSPPRLLPVPGDVTLTGDLPPGATSVSFRFPEVLGPVVLTIERPGEEPYAEPVEAGCSSATFTIAPARAPNALAPARARAAAPAHDDPRALGAALKYLKLGFTHILPHGPDHVLFVLGLFLLSANLRPLLWQVTAFTVAHSITLALALYGVVRLPSGVVEPLIAASIAFVALENLYTSELKPWRPFVVFGFGLVHGLGFAGVLSDVGLPREQFVTALLTFNGGVELGQLAVIALALAAVGWLRGRAWYRAAIVLPASTAIALVAMFWTIERIWA